MCFRKNVFVCLCVCRIGARTVHPIAMKVSEIVVNLLAVILGHSMSNHPEKPENDTLRLGFSNKLGELYYKPIYDYL